VISSTNSANLTLQVPPPLSVQPVSGPRGKQFDLRATAYTASGANPGGSAYAGFREEFVAASPGGGPSPRHDPLVGRDVPRVFCRWTVAASR